MASWLLAIALTGVINAPSDCMLIHFTADWCEPCKQLQPSLDQLKSQGWTIRTVNCDREPLLVRRFQIQQLPTLVIVRDSKELDRVVGAAPPQKLMERLAQATKTSLSASITPLAGQLESLPAQLEPLMKNLAASVPAVAAPSMTVRGQSPVANSLQGLNASVAQIQSAAETGLGSIAKLNEVGRNLQNSLQTNLENNLQNGAALLQSNSAPLQNVAPNPHAGRNQAHSTSPEQAVRRAHAATVRIRVDEPKSTAFGTGTIVDIHGEEALILTCGHLFRDMVAGSKVTVDLFAGQPQETNVPAEVIDWTANNGAEDIGLLSCRLPMRIEPVPLLPKGERVGLQQQLFSFGCDHGKAPSRRDTQVRSVNRYVGPPNIEIADAPAVGRSGGGLFDMQGRLVGVCNAADHEDNEGIYAAAEVVYAQINRLGLNHLFENSADSNVQLASASTTPSNSQFASLNSARQNQGAVSTASAEAPIRWPDQNQNPPAAAGVSAGAQQLICIVRGADGRDQVVTIDQPSSQLLQTIQTQAK